MSSSSDDRMLMTQMKSTHPATLSSLVLSSLVIAQVHAFMNPDNCYLGESSSLGQNEFEGSEQQQCFEAEYIIVKLITTTQAQESCTEACKAEAEWPMRSITTDQLLGIGGQCNPVGWICFSLKGLSAQTNNSTNYDFGMPHYVNNPEPPHALAYLAPLGCEQFQSHEQSLRAMQSIYRPGNFEQRPPFRPTQCRCTLGIKFGALSESALLAFLHCSNIAILQRLRGAIQQWEWGTSEQEHAPDETFDCDDQGDCDCGSSERPKWVCQTPQPN